MFSCTVWIFIYIVLRLINTLSPPNPKASKCFISHHPSQSIFAVVLFLKFQAFRTYKLNPISYFIQSEYTQMYPYAPYFPFFDVFQTSFMGPFSFFLKQKLFYCGSFKNKLFRFLFICLHFALILKLYCICVNNSDGPWFSPRIWRISPLCSGDNLAVRLNRAWVGFVLTSSTYPRALQTQLCFLFQFSACVEVHTDTADPASKPKGAQWTSVSMGNAFIFPPSSLRWGHPLGGLVFSFPGFWLHVHFRLEILVHRDLIQDALWSQGI